MNFKIKRIITGALLFLLLFVTGTDRLPRRNEDISDHKF